MFDRVCKTITRRWKICCNCCEQSELPFISMAAKWAPREAKSYDKKYKVVDEILTYMFGESAMKEDKHRCVNAIVVSSRSLIHF